MAVQAKNHDFTREPLLLLNGLPNTGLQLGFPLSVEDLLRIYWQIYYTIAPRTEMLLLRKPEND